MGDDAVGFLARITDWANMGKKIAKRDPRDIQLAGFTLTAIGVEIAGKPTLEDWRAAMQFIDRAASASMWWHGDMLNFGYASYGELASQKDGDGKYDYGTTRNAKYVAENVPLSRRRDTLSFGHHQVVAPLPPDQQKKWLETAADDGLSVSALRKATADFRAAKEVEPAPVDFRELPPSTAMPEELNDPDYRHN